MSDPRDLRRLVVAAQSGDGKALDELVRTHLPLVYNLAGRALSSVADIDDVVQETMLRVVEGLAALRRPDSFRRWLITITAREVGARQQAAARRTVALDTAPEPVADFEGLAILRLRLSGQRRQVAEAARWLDADHRLVLSLWWLENAGEMRREDTAAGLDTTVAYAGVRVQRMLDQLAVGRSVVEALSRTPTCSALSSVLAGWDGVPAPLWRKRIGRHVRDCPACSLPSRERIPAERLLIGALLVPVPAGLAVAVAAASTTEGAAGVAVAAEGAKHGGFLRAPRSTAAKTVAAGVATALVAAAVAYAAVPDPPTPAAQQADPPSVTTVLPGPPSTTTSMTTTITTTTTTTTVTTTAATVSAASPLTTGCPSEHGPGAPWANWPVPNPPAAGRPNPAAYAILGDGTVRDQVTCLVWQRGIAPTVLDWAAAKQYCAGLTLAGGGWRLPTRVELTSIADHSRAQPAIDVEAFPGTPPRFFWTATPWAIHPHMALAWRMNFYEGLATNGGRQVDLYHVRCVRSATGSGRPSYRITADQVTDPNTGLTWQRGTSPTAMTAQEATAYCAALAIGGHRWRLPGLRELSSTVDDSRVAPAIDVAAFPDTANKTWYWTADTAAPDPSARWALNYDDGFTNYRNITTGRARCVR
ncbi:sigma-70 family RNA polymerase sigma factor [Saccharothrix sp. S26]|uniref:sigma-70 family RNA polymerase sigma factor n=1 Tax=Saccharothrix sp. S26 TaxID=2907215 RepID=UPI001F2586FF|nr:sigma-70 family RNA polymerase sigma factor [Saccharothrix sp. S26]MCE6995547.1 sigma-70 family RNA polymerase sigma factor [Saccharothrix sp. S26]